MQQLMNATCSPADPFGPQFSAAIQQELERINAFYSEQEQQLEVVTELASQHEPLVFAMVLNPQPRHLTVLWLQAALADLQQGGQTSFAQFRSEVTDLRKFVVLNYIAVIKAFKKRNRHLQVIHFP